jgi:hypothetical protein
MLIPRDTVARLYGFRILLKDHSVVRGRLRVSQMRPQIQAWARGEYTAALSVLANIAGPERQRTNFSSAVCYAPSYKCLLLLLQM